MITQTLKPSDHVDYGIKISECGVSADGSARASVNIIVQHNDVKEKPEEILETQGVYKYSNNKKEKELEAEKEEENNEPIVNPDPPKREQLADANSEQ